MEKIIGIDLGTTNSAVSLIQDEVAIVLEDENGEKLLPSVVGISPEGNLLVGAEALRQYAADPDATVKSVKRKMGTDHQFLIKDKTFSAAEISALILKKLKERAEKSIGEEVQKAVITVPAYFSDAQRQATKQAGELAGLEVVRIINEPTAAALVYNYQAEEPEKVLVYDLGGGTFDVSIVEVSGDITEVLASHGNNMLGGDDFDRKLQNLLVLEFEKKHGVDLRNDNLAMARLERSAEKAKINLSSYAFVEVNEEFLSKKGKEPLHLNTTVERNEFEDLIASQLESTLTSIDRALEDAQLTAKDIDRVILAGGSTRIPMVKKLIENHLGLNIYDEVNPDLCVAMGASYQAAMIAGESISSILVDVTPYSLGVEALIESPMGFIPNYFSVIIPRNTVVPVSRSEIYSNPQDNMDKVLISIYQGEQPTTDGNILLGKFWIEGLPKARANTLKFEVHFDFDVNGILNVTVNEQISGKKSNLTITSSDSKLSQPQMVQVKERLDKLWDSAEPEVGIETDEEMELPELTSDQQELYDKSQKMLDTLENQDEKEDLRQLVDDFIAAIKKDDNESIDRFTEELSDILYYMDK